MNLMLRVILGILAFPVTIIVITQGLELEIKNHFITYFGVAWMSVIYILAD